MGEFIGISITLLERQIEWMEDQDWITNRSQFIRELIEMAREGRSYRQIEKRTKVRPKPEMKTKKKLDKKKENMQKLSDEIKQSELFKRRKEMK